MEERLLEPDPEDVDEKVSVTAEADKQAEPEAGSEPESEEQAQSQEPAGPDQWEKLLSTEEGQRTLTQLIDSLLAEEQVQIAVEAKEEARREQQKALANTLAEAYKEAQETGDWSRYGELRAKMDAQAAILQRVTSALQPEIESRVMSGVIEMLDNVVEGTFGDVLSQFSPDELQALRRDNFSSDAEFYSAVMSGIRGKMESIIRAGVEEAAQSSQLAAAAARTAQKARSDGLGILPAGVSEAINRSSSIGELLRMGLGTSAEGEDDSD